ncbi:MAG: hypothetical protein H7319_08045 [Spirosoma sp.]|nr:hypothetical protein [Spirosoma sp.]
MKSSLFFTLFLALTVWSCGSKNGVDPVSERIKKSWSASLVRENSATTYTKGAATNVRPGYSGFQLDLSNSGTVVFIDFDGTRVTGQWSISADEKTLTLTNLVPQPTGTNGTIAFTITELTDTRLVLTRTTANLKTGGTTNVYELTNP